MAIKLKKDSEKPLREELNYPFIAKGRYFEEGAYILVVSSNGHYYKAYPISHPNYPRPDEVMEGFCKSAWTPVNGEFTIQSSPYKNH